MKPRATITILLAVWAVMGDWAAAAAPAAAPGRSIEWQAVSQREPSADAARRQAQQQLLQLARDAIQQRFASPGQREALMLLGILRQTPQVDWQEQIEEQATEYGLMHCCRIVVRMEPQCLEAAVEQLAAQLRLLRLKRLAACGATLVYWLLLGWAAFRLDRWTLGYRRPLIALVALAAGAWGTAMLWHLAAAPASPGL